jgi:hypothetical protein
VTSSQAEAREILAELRAILEDTLKVLDTTGAKASCHD